MSSARWRSLPHPVRWLVAAAAGGALVAAGLVLMILPGPGIPLLLLGLLVLGSEFAWARRLSDEVKTRTAAVTARVTRRIPTPSQRSTR